MLRVHFYRMKKKKVFLLFFYFIHQGPVRAHRHQSKFITLPFCRLDYDIRPDVDNMNFRSGWKWAQTKTKKKIVIITNIYRIGNKKNKINSSMRTNKQTPFSRLIRNPWTEKNERKKREFVSFSVLVRNTFLNDKRNEYEWRARR